ncbi:CMGC/MAPK protein kinase [Thecamonas trahens ATCC 50062]|uniref:Mitogen-activated protein kinase n=1 Tax=Thecamonas trahens ATCC 50062 TaxID=461836 RepID=A0A0L0D5N6_THETB|nr:CMGC/MAPK protein kinase [Thecamonas trahens ATCC 50062]KNC46613.1 CMGC/MAPK protein kinase [Thecamonas trahens ATCC 50062]|eukprot:XP_013760386.1 CMGC/MAPK protein kinase [Thecamonas trahens ATCC 50062]
MASDKVVFEVCSIQFEVSPRYQLEHLIGTGAYGTICRGVDTENKDGEHEEIAVKKIQDVFANMLDAKRALREIQLLKFLKHKNNNIVEILDVMPLDEDFDDLYIVMSLMETDMRKVIKSDQVLSNEHYQYFLYQLLRAIKFMHSAGVIHRDLKPANILLDSRCNLKVCDFGLSRLDTSHHSFAQDNGDYTEYVCTRWYRAPEVIFERGAYTKAVDMWSVGCIFAELIGRKALFPGKDHVHQLSLIYRIIGTPSMDEIMSITNDMAREHMLSEPRYDPVPFSEILPGLDPLAEDLLSKLLTSNPADRLTAEEALSHPYLAALHSAIVEPTAPAEFELPYVEADLTEDDLRALIYNEMLYFHPEIGAHNRDMKSADDATW